MRVNIKGVIYETVQDAATAYNVTRKQILRRLNAGTIDKIKIKSPDNRQGRPEPVTIAGLTFKNQETAKAALGLPLRYFTVHLSEYKNKQRVQDNIDAAVKLYKAKQGAQK